MGLCSSRLQAHLSGLVSAYQAPRTTASCSLRREAWPRAGIEGSAWWAAAMAGKQRFGRDDVVVVKKGEKELHAGGLGIPTTVIVCFGEANRAQLSIIFRSAPTRIVTRSIASQFT